MCLNSGLRRFFLALDARALCVIFFWFDFSFQQVLLVLNIPVLKLSAPQCRVTRGNALSDYCIIFHICTDELRTIFFISLFIAMKCNE